MVNPELPTLVDHIESPSERIVVGDSSELLRPLEQSAMLIFDRLLAKS